MGPDNAATRASLITEYAADLKQLRDASVDRTLILGAPDSRSTPFITPSAVVPSRRMIIHHRAPDEVGGDVLMPSITPDDIVVFSSAVEFPLIHAVANEAVERALMPFPRTLKTRHSSSRRLPTAFVFTVLHSKLATGRTATILLDDLALAAFVDEQIAESRLLVKWQVKTETLDAQRTVRHLTKVRSTSSEALALIESFDFVNRYYRPIS